MSPRPDVSAERKEEILGAAARVFAKLGFQKARMDDIVRASGLSKGALYWYFAGKDDLIIGLLDRMFGGSMHLLYAALEEADPVPERLRRLSQATLEDIDRSRALISLTYEFYVMAMRSKLVRKYLHAYYRRYRGALRQLVAEGVRRKELRGDCDPEVSALSFMALIDGLLLYWIISPEDIRFPEQLTIALEQWLTGLEAHPKKATQRAT